MISQTVTHYKIFEKVGEGGMGEVYLAEDTKLKRHVALKFLPRQLTADNEARERFEREAQAAAALNHPNIVTVYEIGEHEGQVFIAMEYVEGQTLKELISGVGACRDTPSPGDLSLPITSHPLPITQVIDIATQIASGLAAAHAKGIVHRDIKPQNILVDKNNHVKILDFGLAKLKGVSSLTKESSTLGTVHYMSPEQTMGKEVDHRTDIWSFGVVLYEMLTGKLPFKGDYDQAVIYSILNEEMEAVTSLRLDIPPGVASAITKALQKNPALRYQNAGEFSEDLKSGASADIQLIRSRKSVVVLPFANLSSDPEQEYFCDGMAEEIINSLTHIEDLRVVARTSAFSFKDKKLDVREIGTRLNAEYVLEGSVRKAGTRLRITAQLINVTDGFHLWSERFDRESADVFAIQDEISLAITDKLKINLLGQDRARIMKRYTDNRDAHELYLKGRFFWNKRNSEGFQKAMDYFQQALAIDPAYAPALSGIADSYLQAGWYDFLPTRETMSKAGAAITQALAADDNLAEAYNSLAMLKGYEWDYAKAEECHLRAIGLNPGYPTAHHWYALFLSEQGRHDEAIVEAQKALELDPLSLPILNLTGSLNMFARRYEAALDCSKKVLEFAKDYYPIYICLPIVYANLEMHDEAVAAAQRGVKITGGNYPLALSILFHVYARANRPQEAMHAFERLLDVSKNSYVSPCVMAGILGQLGRMDEAFHWLEKAFLDHDHWLVLMKVNPFADSLRSDPRFSEIMKRIGLEK